jgi:hypothetical protein
MPLYTTYSPNTVLCHPAIASKASAAVVEFVPPATGAGREQALIQALAEGVHLGTYSSGAISPAGREAT